MSDARPLDLVRMAAPEKRRLAVACLTAVLGTVLGVLPFLLVAVMLDAAQAGDTARLWWAAGGAALALLCQGPLMGLSTGVAHVSAFDLLFAIRGQLMRKLVRLPLGSFTKRQTGGLKRILNEEVEALELFISHQLPDVVASLATLLLLAGTAFWVDWRLALATMAVLPLAYLAQILIMRGHAPNIGEYFGRIGKINASAIEFVQGMETIKSFRGGALVHDDMRRQVDGLYSFSETWRQGWMKPWVFYTVVTGAAPLFVLPLGLWLHGAGAIDPGALVFCLFVATGFGAPLVKLTLYSEIFLRVQQAETKIRAVIEAEEIAMPEGPPPALPDHSIAFENVGFAQDGRTLLDDVSFTLPAGGISAIVGPSGAGKTTLIRLLIRSWDVDSGRIAIGGQDIRLLRPDHLAGLVAIVAQDVFLFDDTIRANLRLARAGATDEDIERAARAAHCDAFIASLPKGYDTRVGEAGVRLSGGQRQRLALARALVAGSPVLVLDEATAFADPYHEGLLQDAIGRLVGEKTVIVVSHRLDAVEACDRIVFVEDGRVVAVGTHDELERSSVGYRRNAEIQRANLAWRIEDDTSRPRGKRMGAAS